MPAKRGRSVRRSSSVESVVSSTSRSLSSFLPQISTQTMVVLAIHLVVCTFLAMVHSHVRVMWSFDLFTGTTNPLVLPTYMFFAYAFFPLFVVLLGAAVLGWFRILRNLGTGRLIQWYLTLALFMIFAYGVYVSNLAAWSLQVGISAMIYVLYLFFRPVLITTFVYVLLGRKIQEWAGRLRQM